jgi:hypothetical protein
MAVVGSVEEGWAVVDLEGEGSEEVGSAVEAVRAVEDLVVAG